MTLNLTNLPESPLTQGPEIVDAACSPGKAADAVSQTRRHCSTASLLHDGASRAEQVFPILRWVHGPAADETPCEKAKRSGNFLLMLG